MLVVQEKSKFRIFRKEIFHAHTKMIGKFIFLVAYQLCTADALNLGRVYVSELFSTKIEPQKFNWTFGRPEQFQYRPSLKGYPDLPSWMRYTYSSEYYAGYLYGTPPLNYAGRQVYLLQTKLERFWDFSLQLGFFRWKSKLLV